MSDGDGDGNDSFSIINFYNFYNLNIKSAKYPIRNLNSHSNFQFPGSHLSARERSMTGGFFLKSKEKCPSHKEHNILINNKIWETLNLKLMSVKEPGF